MYPGHAFLNSFISVSVLCLRLRLFLPIGLFLPRHCAQNCLCLYNIVWQVISLQIGPVDLTLKVQTGRPPFRACPPLIFQCICKICSHYLHSEDTFPLWIFLSLIWDYLLFLCAGIWEWMEPCFHVSLTLMTTCLARRVKWSGPLQFGAVSVSNSPSSVFVVKARRQFNDRYCHLRTMKAVEHQVVCSGTTERFNIVKLTPIPAVQL